MRVVARRLALFTALTTMVALFAVSGIASATHGAGALQVTPEDDTNVAGEETHAYTATLSAASADAIIINFEIESGPGDTDGNTPTSPDLTCGIGIGGTTCTTGAYAALTPGTDVVRAWISTHAADTTEGHRADATADEPATGTVTPGTFPEPDQTDVVHKDWVSGPARNIDAEPNTDTNPSGTVHRVVATVTDAEGRPVEGAVVTFTEDGTGRFAANADDEDAVLPGRQVSTDANGEAETFTETFPGEEGDQEITAEIDVAVHVECDDPANVPDVGDTAGNCDETVVKTWGPGVGDDCTITGTEGDDVLEGTDGDDVICGLAGNDTITGLAGNDTLKGGAGNDTVKGGAGDDTVRGGGGNDALRGGPGNDTVRGGGGNDNLKGGSGNDALRGGRGTDACRGGPGNDSIRGCEN
jgi:Ca2+-binding RTX toxin-like protein